MRKPAYDLDTLLSMWRVMMNEHPSTETPREYGELFYSPDSVATLLRVVAELLEADKRGAVLALSHSLPTTMPWPADSANSEQQTSEPALYRPVQLRVFDFVVLGPDTLRLTCLLRRGSVNMRSDDREHASRMANEPPDSEEPRTFESIALNEPD